MPSGPKTHPDTEKAIKLVDEGKVTAYAAALKYHLSPSTVYKALKARAEKAVTK